ncbi:MAG: hypothetical protein ACK4SA_15425 [Caldilinea sp.]
MPRARGERQRLIEEATGFKDREVLRATGEAERFLAVLNAYQLAPEVTRERLHIEALERVLNHVDLVLLDKDAVGGSQVLPFLPLTEAGSSAQRSEIREASPDQTTVRPETTTEGE